MAQKKVQKQDQAIKCIDCKHAAEPEGSPVVVSCAVCGRKLVGEALRHCQFYNAKNNVR